jgi:hypothetical protein
VPDEKAVVEVTTRYATSVDTLADAWAFIMARLDSVGPDPTIRISPCWTISMGDSNDDVPPRHFEVVVEGMVAEP